ncbi:MAG: TonB-dependent receptor [Saprospiraceae bacterium]|nr:TonB-dependent receptor [Saprospiraceae bacterium]
MRPRRGTLETARAFAQGFPVVAARGRLSRVSSPSAQEPQRSTAATVAWWLRVDPRFGVYVFAGLVILTAWAIVAWRISAEQSLERDRLRKESANLVSAYEEQVLRSIQAIDQTMLLLKSEYEQRGGALDFTRYFKNTLKGVNVAFGLEHRIDRYEIFAGEEGSWQTYGPVIFAVEDGDTIYRPGGAQGFPGFSPANEVNESRTNLGAYVDTEFDLSDRFMVGAAVRFEEYSDFGSTFNGKIAARLQVASGLALRASASTGFRAPSLAQIHFNSIFTDFVSGVAVDKFLARNNSPITRQLGIPELKQERSVNASAGLTFNSGALSLTIDGYYVKVQDRIVLTGDFSADDPDIGQELQAINVGSARFFTNAVNTSTTGADIILAYATRLGNGHRLSATLAANVNDMKIDKVNTSDKLKGKEDIYFSNRERLFLLASAPNTKGNLALEYKTNRLGINARLTYFDKITLEDYVGALDVYKAATTLDLSLSLELSRNIRLTVGGANILDAYPTRQDVETESGGLWDSVQMGFNGAFYFTRIGFKF